MPATAQSGLQALTAREREVLRLFAQGLEGPEVARALGLSAKTVETHVRNARAKLGGVRRPAAARLVAEDDRAATSAVTHAPLPTAVAPDAAMPAPTPAPADMAVPPTRPSPRAASGIPAPAFSPHPAGVDASGGDAEMVREDRAIFLHLPATAPDRRIDRDAEDHGSPALYKLLAIAALGFAVMAALALVAPVTDGLQRWADMIHRHRTN